MCNPPVFRAILAENECPAAGLISTAEAGPQRFGAASWRIPAKAEGADGCGPSGKRCER